MSGGGSRVSIPNSVRKTIENIKEITGNHSDDEIYAMLKECSMDPNETTQKLLLQDTFHEVKSKRERRKENANNRESVESRWKTGVQGRGSRGGRIYSSSRYISHDAGGGRNSGSGKENGVNQVIEKGVSLPMPTSQEMKNKEKIPVTSSVPVENCATIVASGGVPEITSLADISGKGSSLPPVNANKNPTRAFGTRNSSEQPAPKSDNSAVSITLASSSSALSSSSSDPSNESQLLGAADASKCDGGASLHSNEPSTVNHVENKLILEAMEISDSLAQENQPIKPHKIEESQPNEISPPSVSTHGGSLVNQPNYNKRPQQVIGPHKASSNKEWKPKTTSSVVIQQSRAIGAAAASEVPVVTFEATDLSQPATRVLDSEEATLKLQKKLEELHISKSQLVIIPNHIQVPESERSKLSFGSFGSFATSFGVSATVLGGPESDQRPTPPSETSVDVDESLEEETSSYPNALGTTEDVDSPERSQSPTHMPENLSPGGDLSSGTIHEYNDLKQESGFPSGGHTNSVQTSSGYSFGFISPVVGSQISAVENSDSQGRDASRLPGFVVQPPFDPSSYYAQFYRSGDNDGRLSPFLSPGVAAKYNGNVALLPPTSSQSPQEGVVTAGPTALLTQAAGLMQSSLAVTQQPVPVFRPPAGVHISHYPPNYIPYGHYFSPFYVPPPPIHQFVGNNAFPQQPQGGNVYQAPPPAATAAVKYSIPQYKMGANSGNSSHIGMPSGYGPYGSSASGFSPSTAAQAGNTTTNEELGASQFKENSVYITGPQSDGSAVWIGAPGRDMSSLPANAFYNLPPQGQHLTFTPTQTGHGTFASIYHPAQAVNAANVHPLLQQSQAVAAGVDTVGPGGNIYQQPQHSQINWPNNY